MRPHCAPNPWGQRWHCPLPQRQCRATAQADLYAVLELQGPDVTDAEVKRSFRRLARQWHPDVNRRPDAAAQFRRISAAFSAVMNDRQTRTAERQQAPWPASPRARGADVAAELALDLEQAVLGGQHSVEVSALALCIDCGGSGAQRESGSARCQLCHGHGDILQSQRTAAGRHTCLQPCPSCRGRGLHVLQRCACCAGEGLTRQLRHVDLAVPAGVDNAAVLRLQGQGDAGAAGGPAGDAIITVMVRHRKGLTRQGLDLHSPLLLPLWDALLGGEVTVTTVRGVAVQLVVPPGTAHGAVLSLPREGVDARGAHHFEVKIATPTALTAAEEVLVRRLAAVHAASA